jgi:hypothetical protein
MNKSLLQLTVIKTSHQLKKVASLLFFLVFIGSFSYAQRIRYVCTEGSGKQDGSSWANASSDLHKMINLSAPGDQIWVCGNLNSPTVYTKVVSKDKKSGVKGYMMKLCTYKEQDPSSYIFIDPHSPLRIPQYPFHVIRTKSKDNPPLFLVMQIV